MELFEKINSLEMPCNAFRIGWSWDEDQPKHHDGLLHYESNEQIRWDDLNNEKIIQFLEYLDYNIEYKVFMYKQDIPEAILSGYSEFLDWDYITRLNKNIKVEKYQDKLNWNIIWKHHKFSIFNIKKYIDKVNWDDLSLYQSLNPDFIKEYKDKLNWHNLCITQTLSPTLLIECEEYLTPACWINISRYQVLSTLFIDKYADKLNWDALSVYQDITDSLLIEKYANKINWDLAAKYQKFNIYTLEHYCKHLDIHDIFKNRNIKLDNDYLMKHIDDIDEVTLGCILEKQSVSDSFLNAYIEKNPHIWNCHKFSEAGLMEKTANLSAITHLSREFIIKYKDKISWKDMSVSNLTQLPYGLLFEVRYQLTKDAWKYLSRCIELPEDFIDAAFDVVDWESVSMMQTLSEDFIDKHKDMVDWVYVSIYQKLSEKFVKEHKDYIYWPQYLVTHHNASIQLIKDCVDHIHLKFISNYIELPDSFFKDMRKHFKDEKAVVFDHNGNVDKNIRLFNDNKAFVDEKFDLIYGDKKKETEKSEKVFIKDDVIVEKPVKLTAIDKVKNAVSDFILKFRK